MAAELSPHLQMLKEASSIGNGAMKKKAAEEKKEEGIVLKVDLHCKCEGCVKKLMKAANRFQGVETAELSPDGKLHVGGGKVDVEKLRERIQSKMKKKVQILSPLPNKKPPQQRPAPGADKKTKELQPTTVIFKIRLHCDGCTHRIRKTIRKQKGVRTVEIDTEKDIVTVKGAIDVKELQAYLKKKLKRNVDVVPPKKEAGGAGGQEKKPGEGDAERRPKGVAAMGGGNGAGAAVRCGGGGGAGNNLDDRTNGCGYGYGNNGNGYVVEYVHAPQIFSDENPNACQIM